MSSGVEADIALDAAVVLSLGLNRVLGGAAGLAAGGADALAALAAGRAEARAAALHEVERYDQAIRAVIDVNARIATLAAAERRAAEEYDARPDITLPRPFTFTGQPVEELESWCVTTGAALDDAEQKVSAGIAAAVAGRIFALPARSLDRTLRATDRVADGAEATDAAAADRHDLAETLARVLGRVLPDAAEADRRHIAEAAERLTAARTAGDAEGLLTEVRLRVQAANRNTEAAREEAARLAEAERARRQAEAERHYVLDTITAAFDDLGYEVDTGFETMTAQDDAILLTRGDWPEHAVRMRLDAGDATLRAAMLRAGEPQSEEDRRVDVDREREWCEAFERARDRLAAAGVHSHVRWRIEPGHQRLPSAPEARRTGHRTGQRERRRERPQ